MQLSKDGKDLEKEPRPSRIVVSEGLPWEHNNWFD